MRLHIAAAALAAAAFSALLTPGPAAAQDAAAGRRKAVACQTCHGIDGIAKLPDAPHLAGQPAAYMVRELNAYRSGTRRNEVMSVVAKTLSDDDIRDLAAWYASIPIEARVPPQ